MALRTFGQQIALPGLCQVDEAVSLMAAAGMEERGAVFTRREVVDFILDLSGYTTDRPLHRMRLLEPSMGQGDFLTPVIDRLLEAYQRDPQRTGDPIADLGECVLAVELHRDSYRRTREVVAATLRGKGLKAWQSTALCDRWLKQGDFLLLDHERAFTHVIGNPPYVRQEMVPDVLMAEYRRRYRTIYDRADIYIPFIEQSLSLLAPGGTLGFICADRWLKNRYGGPLRRYVSEGFHLRHFVDMVGTNAFLSEVVAYPGIVVISRAKSGPTRIASRPAINTHELQSLARSMTAPKLGRDDRVTEATNVVDGAEPWMLEAPGQLALIRRLETAFPTLEEAGCKVGIGVATGADHAFIGPYSDLDVEPDRKLPLVMTRDILRGTVEWRGFGVVNPFGPNGKLVPLKSYPKLAAYLDRHSTVIKARHVSKKNPVGWYRTIDRIYPELATTAKLLIPDIKGAAHIVYESGKLYPHHNLYFVTAADWDLRALQAVLLSNVTHMFIALYSTKMRGGYLRFQAQYLRRLRLPFWRDVPEALRADMIRAAKSRDSDACNKAAAALYGLTPAERLAVGADARVADAA